MLIRILEMLPFQGRSALECKLPSCSPSPFVPVGYKEKLKTDGGDHIVNVGEGGNQHMFPQYS